MNSLGLFDNVAGGLSEDYRIEDNIKSLIFHYTSKDNVGVYSGLFLDSIAQLQIRLVLSTSAQSNKVLINDLTLLELMILAGALGQLATAEGDYHMVKIPLALLGNIKVERDAKMELTVTDIGAQKTKINLYTEQSPVISKNLLVYDRGLYAVNSNKRINTTNGLLMIFPESSMKKVTKRFRQGASTSQVLTQATARLLSQTSGYEFYRDGGVSGKSTDFYIPEFYIIGLTESKQNVIGVDLDIAVADTPICIVTQAQYIR